MNFLVLSGDGINCDQDISFLLSQKKLRHSLCSVQDLIDQKITILDYDCLIIPGGFSFADRLGSGKVLALKLKYFLKKELEQFVNHKKYILGICNGFQVLVELGLLPHADFIKKVSLRANKNEKFINKWTQILINKKSTSPWLKNIESDSFFLPIRHGEGNFSVNDHHVLASIIKNNQIAFTYSEDLNGSMYNIAGITDTSGHILGLMPHPESDQTKQAWVLFDSLLKYEFENKILKNNHSQEKILTKDISNEKASTY